MKTYTIEQVNIGEINDYDSFPVGVKIGGSWYNAFIKDAYDLGRIRDIKKGDKVVLELYKKKGKNGKEYDNFRLPVKVDLLEERVSTLEQFIKDLIKQNDLKYGL